jgi:hypothetical protein
LFISTGKEILFASGNIPSEFNFRLVYAFPAYYGSDQIQSATLIADGGSSGKVVVFTTSQGICVGFQDGSVKNVTERKVKLLEHAGDVCAVIFNSKYVVSLTQ